jgi:serine/threonine-protein kinase mTOR
LTLLQKIEVFEVALENTAGQDLYKVLWLKSKNSEVWLERRTNYTRSLAVMSIVGYILGLGDRHPSNLMIDRFTGKVIHIDFGDCFEVAMHREKFPEKIPFRLTRMLINAMEVSGIEGNYRITSEHVMRVLRDNKDSLMAVLEAFVYDPLLNWRLGTTKGEGGAGAAAGGAGAAAGGPKGKMDTDLLDDQGLGRGARKQRNENDLIMAGMCTCFVCLCFVLVCRSFPNTSDAPIPTEDNANKPEALNPRALTVINRVHNKLTGRDFKPQETLQVPMQVERLILQATSLENLCQCYVGWCSFW